MNKLQTLMTEIVLHRRTDRGASLVEYALLLALIAVVCVVAIAVLGQSGSESFDSNGSSLFG